VAAGALAVVVEVTAVVVEVAGAVVEVVVVSVDVGVVLVVVEAVSVDGGVVSVVPDDETVDVSVDELPVSVTARTAPKPPAERNPAINRATKIRPAHDFLLGPPSFANGAIPRSPRSFVQSRRAWRASGTRLAYTNSSCTPVSCPARPPALPHCRRNFRNSAIRSCSDGRGE